MPRRLSAVIVDDEPMSVDVLRSDLESFGDIEILAAVNRASEALASVPLLKPDVLFLDVELGADSGIELLQTMRAKGLEPSTRVVFYTAFDKYVIDALRSSAFDFLLKPYMPDELYKVMERIRTDFSAGRVAEQNISELTMRMPASSSGRFAIQTVNSLMFLRPSDVLYFEYSGIRRCWSVVLSDLKSHRLRMSIKARDILVLSKSFVKVNSDTILNIDYLSYVENGSLRCVLVPPYDSISIVASRRHFSDLRDALTML
ncbi:MAG: hypothetical protein BHV77_00545 [Bacteroides sp. 43_108]|nr:MAG: hypothetical protein BHV77_00545 [Bacteroides sp. 43_108]